MVVAEASLVVIAKAATAGGSAILTASKTAATATAFVANPVICGAVFGGAGAVVIGIGIVVSVFLPDKGSKVPHPQTQARPEVKRKREEKKKYKGIHLQTQEGLDGYETKVQSHPGPETNYTVFEYPTTGKGLVYIYNATSNRMGAQKDENAVRLFFARLNFTVLHNERDLSRDDLMKSVKEASESFESEDFYCCLVFVMAHGIYGNIRCDDGKNLQLNEIYKAFYTKKRGVPKLFFVQACRGHSEECDDLPAAAPCRIPQKADFIVYYATDEGDKAWRDPNNGSWFIQEIVSVFRNMYKTHHVVDMLTTLCGNLNKKCTLHGDQQLTNQKGQLSAHLYLR